MQQRERRIAAQLVQNVVQTAVDLFKFILVLYGDFVAPAKTKRKADIQKLQQMLIARGFAYQPLQQDKDLLTTPCFIVEMHQQRLLNPFVFVRPAVTQRRLINKGAEDVAKRDDHARLVALFLK